MIKQKYDSEVRLIEIPILPGFNLVKFESSNNILGKGNMHKNKLSLETISQEEKVLEIKSKKYARRHCFGIQCFAFLTVCIIIYFLYNTIMCDWIKVEPFYFVINNTITAFLFIFSIKIDSSQIHEKIKDIFFNKAYKK